MSAALPPEVAAALEKRARRVGKYVLVNELGQGAMGVVWRAYDVELARWVALKTVKDAGALGDEDLRRLLREARTGGKLDHPGIVRTLDVFDWNKRPVVVLELIEGENLEAHLARGSLAPARIAALVRDVATALAHAHERGVIHRDVKPGNVLLDREGRPHLSDFGLARDVLGASASLSKTGDLIGTPSYMAPEQAAGETSWHGAHTDVYALGVLLYRMLVGTEPFLDSPGLDVFLQRVRREAPPHPCVVNPLAHPDLAALALECLAKDPAARPSAAEVAASLQRFLAKDHSKPPQPAPEEKARPPARSRAWLVAPALALAVVAVGVAVALRGPSAPRHPWPTPSSDLALAWNLDGGAPASLAPSALWEGKDGRVADPWRSLTAKDATLLAASFLGSVRVRERGRVLVQYDLARAARVRVRQSAKFIANAPGPSAGRIQPGPLEGDERTIEVTAPNDTGQLVLAVGDALFGEAKATVRVLPHRIDASIFGIALGDDPARTLSIGGRSQTAILGSSTLTCHFDEAWHALALDPFARKGEPRGRVDESTIASREDPAPSDVPCRVSLWLDEGAFRIGALGVEGRPLRGDVPARAVLPVALPARARIACAFERDGEGLGGPFVGVVSTDGAVEVRLELIGRSLVLRRGDRRLGALELPAPAPRSGWLALERRVDGFHATVGGASGERSFSAVDPLPLAGELRACYGSAAPRTRFTAAALHLGADDPERSLHDRTPLPLEADATPPAAARVAWRRAALLLARTVDPSWGVAPEVLGTGLSAPELRERCVRTARDALLGAAERLDDPLARNDALARAVLASVVAGDAKSAREASEKLVALVGRAGARDLVDALEQDERPLVIGNLLDGWVLTREGHVEEAALAAAEVLVLEERGKILFGRADIARRLGRAGDAIALFEQARRGGADPGLVDMKLGEIYLARDQLDESLAAWTRASERRPGDFWPWLRRALVLVKLARGVEALESSLVALARVRGKPEVLDLVENIAINMEPVTPGLAAAAFLALANVRGEPADSPVRAKARALAERTKGNHRDGDLARYVRARSGERAIAPPDRTRPTSALALARPEDRASIEALRAAVREDRLVESLVRLDPLLAPTVEK